MTQHNETRAALTELIEAVEAAHTDLFRQCCSNPIKNAWGKEVSVLKLNEAAELASRFKSVHAAAPSLPAGGGLTDEQIDAIFRKYRESGMTHTGGINVQRKLIRDVEAAILAAPRQPGEVGAGVRRDSCYVCGQPAMYCASKHHEVASAQQDEREAKSFDQWFQSEQGKPYDSMWAFAKAAWQARAAQQVQADAGAVAEADDLLRACHRWHAGDSHTKKRIENVRAALAAHPSPAAESDKRDAERYRWMRDKSHSLEHLQRDLGVDNGMSCYQVVGGARELKSDRELDDAIDAAMSREQSGGGE